MKKTVLLIAGLVLTLAASAQKIGYINSAAILAEMPEVKQADSNLEALQKQLQKKGQDMLEKLQKDYAAVQAKVQNGELSPKQQEEEGARLEAARQDIAKFEQESVDNLEKKRNDELKPIYDKINQAIKDVATENGFTYIFDQGVMVYADETMDVGKLVRAKLGM